MRKFTKEVRGSIALFLSMIILLLVILEGFLIDGSKVMASKMFMSSAGEMSLNAGLTYYDEALRDIYGLFATSKTEEELTEALKVYFQETLGEATGSTDEGYVDQLLDYVNTAISTGWDGEEAGRLLDLQTATFSAKGVSNSALSENYVIKNQILEYMKYRGPASLGYGMIEKIYAFKDLDKQQKTLESKLDYEETMSDVQNACEEAYSNIEPYNQLLDGDLKPETVEQKSYEINKNFYEAIIATWCYSMLCRDPEIDKEWKKNTGISGHNVPAAANACILEPSMSAIYDQMLIELSGDFDTHPDAAVKAVKVIIGYKEDFQNYCNLHTTWLNYQEYYEKEMEALLAALDDLDEDDDGEDIEAEIEALEKEREEYEELYNTCADAIELYKNVLEEAKPVLKNDIDTRMTSAVNNLNDIASKAARLVQLGTLGREALDDVLRNMGTLEQKKGTWQTSIDNLSEGEVKTSMQSDLDNKAEMLDEEKIHILQEKLGNGVDYGNMLLNGAKDSKILSYIPYNQQKSTYSLYMKSWLEGIDTYSNETNPYVGDSFRTFSESSWVYNANHTGALADETVTVYFNSNNGGKKQGLITQMDLAIYASQMDEYISAKNDEFFKYLERICPKSDADKENSDSAKEQKKKLFEEAKKISLTPEESLPSMTSSGGEEQSAKFEETDTDASDKKVSQNTKNNTKESSNFLSDVGSLLTKGRDKLYLSEYSTQMFSYYTVDKPKNKSNKETLSGYAFTADHNKMYKAEVEYILWGNTDGNVDVQYTLTTIFGIRFLLNSIYAFTGDPEIRQLSLALATSIAGWTGFGVPLVQSVIIIGFALAETALDLKALKEGDSVPIYKSSNTWQIKPSSLSKEMIGQAINDAGSAAKSFIYEKMDQLTESTKDEFKNKLTEFTDDTVDNLVSTATATVLTPVQENLIGLVNVVSPDQEHIKDRLQEAVVKVKNSVDSEPDSISKEIKLSAINYFSANLINELVSKIQEVQKSENMSNEDITNQINTTIEDCRNKLKSSLKGKATELVNSASTEVNNALDSANEDLQKNTSEAFDKMLMRIDCGVSFAELPDGSDAVKAVGGEGRTSGAAALTMNYKEYLWLFIAVKSVQNEDDILQRIGTLIEANLASSNTKPSENFKIDSAYTFIEVNATADLSTTFFSMPVSLQGGGSVTLGQDKYNIGYKGVLGY